MMPPIQQANKPGSIRSRDNFFCDAKKKRLIELWDNLQQMRYNHRPNYQLNQKQLE